MTELINTMRAADEVCREAYSHFDQSRAYRAEGRRILDKKCFRGILGFAAGAFLTYLLLSVLDALPLLHLITDLLSSFELIPLLLLGAAGFLLARTLRGQLTSKAQEYFDLAGEEDEMGQKILDANAQCLSILPSDYIFPMSTGYILNMLETGRADTIREALAMTDEYIHRQNVENANRQILAQQQEQNARLSQLHTDVSLMHLDMILNR